MPIIKTFLFAMFIGCFMLFATKAAAQKRYSTCQIELIKNLKEQRKKNPCLGGNKFIRLDVFSYNDTLLYRPVFDIGKPCPDYVNSTIYYDEECAVKIRISDGGLVYRHKVSPEWIDEKKIKFVKSISPRKK